ncbi:MAG: TlpA family protein disulfide reductase, partial [Candidatus Saccharimonadales bacterium]
MKTEVSSGQGIHSLPFIPQENIHIGKPCPDVEIAHIINFPATHCRISDFKGKVLILDFYTTRCLGCIASFPKYDSLQREFGDKIQVLLCTTASAKEVRSLFARVEALRKIHLASVVSDTVLSGIFKHRTVPHLVLIDQSGLVRAVTYGVERKDIKALLAGRPVHLLVKRDGGPSFDPEDPQLISDYQYYHRDDHFYFYSYIAPLAVPTSSGEGVEKDKDGNITRTTFQGSIQQLFRIAYDKTDEYNSTRVLLDFKKASSFRTVDQDSGINCYTYDLIMHPGWSPARAYKYMQRQFDAFFNVSSSEKKKRVKCFILRRVDASKPLFSDNEKANVQ